MTVVETTGLLRLVVYLILGTSAISSALSNVQDSNSTGSNEEIISRILYGTPVDIREFPSFVFLGHCGGTILSDSWVLTAAHCVDKFVQSVFHKPMPLWVAGKYEPGNYEYTYDRVIIHPKYVNSPYHDIALLSLTKKLNFSSEVRPAELTKNRTFDEGLMVLVARGDDETGNLADGVEAVQLYGFDCTDTGREETFCAYRQNLRPAACTGDSGSPLYRGHYLVGVIVAIDHEQCSYSQTSFFVSLAHELQWIKSITGL